MVFHYIDVLQLEILIPSEPGCPWEGNCIYIFGKMCLLGDALRFGRNYSKVRPMGYELPLHFSSDTIINWLRDLGKIFSLSEFSH